MEKDNKIEKEPETEETSKEEMAKEWFEKGVEFRKNKQYRKAIPAYQTALRHEPNNPSILNDLAWTYYLMGKYEETVKYAEIAVDLAPKKWFIFDTLACGYFGLRDFEKAWGAFQEMKRLNPDAKGTEAVYLTVKKAMKMQRKLYGRISSDTRSRSGQTNLGEQFQKYEKLIWGIIGITIVSLVIYNIVMGVIVLMSIFS